MSYALLWIETLAVGLLWVAATIAGAARLRRAWVYRLVLPLIFLPPMIVLGAAAAGAGYLKFASRLQENWFGYALSLFLAYTLGGLFILVVASRRLAPGMPRHGAVWPGLRLALAFVTASMVTAMTLWNMDLAVRAQAGAYEREAGALMLSVSPPNVADSRNAATLYERAFALMGTDQSLSALIDKTAKDARDKATADWLIQQAPALKLLRRAAGMPDCRFDHDYARPDIGMLLPELNKARGACHLLSMDVEHQLSEGHVEVAIQDVQAAHQLGEAIGDEPTLICALVAFAVEADAVRMLEQGLPAVTRQDQMSSLDLGGDDRSIHLLHKSLVGEEAFGLSIFSALAGGKSTLSQVLCQVEGSPPAGSTLLANGSNFLTRVFLLTDDVDAYKQTMELHQKARPPGVFPTSANLTIENQQEIRSLHNGLVTALIEPALARASQTAAIAQARHQTASVAIALTRYRIDHGQLPDNLGALVPDYLDAIPLDPFDGKPLRARRVDKAWRIYSVGPDGKDDGGEPIEHDSGDIVFVLKDGR